MNRRTGQNGNVFQKEGPTWNPNAFAYGRYWEDVNSGPRCRKTVPLGRCRTKTIARQKLRGYLAENKINDVETFQRTTAPSLTFSQQAKVWLESLRSRRRRPLKPASIENYEHYLNKRLLPLFGDLPLSEIGNSALKRLVDKMSAEKPPSGNNIAAKTIVNYVETAKLVVASAVNAEGEALYPRKWNDEFIGVPPSSKKDKQHRQTVTGDEVTNIIARSKGRYRTLFSLLPGSGVRIGEALALKPEDFSSDCRVIHITHAIWKKNDQRPKTPASVRDIDIPEQLAALVREYLATIPAGHYLFATASGKPSNTLRILHGRRSSGFMPFADSAPRFCGRPGYPVIWRSSGSAMLQSR